MAEPKKKLSRSRTGNRRRWQALAQPSSSICQQCKKVKTPHRVCPHCGFYKGRKIIKKQTKRQKKQAPKGG